jgi:tetratricopeptide (TPR) repeat protein
MGRLERGDANLAVGRFRRAAELYQNYVRIDDRSPRVLYKLALAHQSAGQPAPAVAALTKAVALDDKFAEAHYLLGVCLRDLNRLPDALVAFERARALAPAMVNARESLGELYGQMGRTRDRIAQLEALAALDPGPSRAVALGLAYHRAGNTNRAVIVLGEAAERFPEHPYAYVALGRVWLESAESTHDRVALSKALGALQEAAGNDDSSEALMLLGRALLLSGDDDLAERMLQQATEKFPVDPLAFYYFAEVTERRGHADQARRALLDYQALEGEDLEARRRASLAVRVADLSMQASDPTAATIWYQRASGLTALDAAVLVRLAEAQLRSGDMDAARQTLARALDKDPANRAARQLQLRMR